MTIPAAWQTSLQDSLSARRLQGLWRVPRTLSSAQGARVQVAGRWFRNFCSNDYLGLAQEPLVRAAFTDAVARYGVGAGAAALVCGHHVEHEALMAELADWLAVPAVLLMGSGYQANLAVLSALTGPADDLFQDRLNHASLLQGGQLSGARQRRYRHNDLSDLTRLITASARSAGRAMVVSDSVFSMDGDQADVPGLQAVCAAHDALLFVDEAHALGVLGPGGRGLCAGTDLLRMGTLGKAFGVSGAFVAGPTLLVDAVQQLGRPAIYTTASPPALAAATRAALRCVQRDDWRRERLQAHQARVRTALSQQGWQLLPSETPIQPVVLGSVETTQAFAQALWDQGIWIAAIRPPTVPDGTARLRVTVTAAHDEADVDALIAAFATLTPPPCP